MVEYTRMLMMFSVFAIGCANLWADAPRKIDVTDAHSVENKGKINLYRVQIQGLEFGLGDLIRGQTHAVSY